MLLSPPDITSSDYLGYFLVWQRGAIYSYIDFDFTATANEVTAIELRFLNNPVNRISLPDIELSRVEYGSSFTTDTAVHISSTLLDNQDLNETDNQVRSVIIQPLTRLTALNLRINFQFQVYHDFDWLMISEVVFCSDKQSAYSPNITFDTLSFNTVQPGSAELARRWTQLVCSVFSDGDYQWLWERDNSTIASGDKYSITVGDASRTSRLIISSLVLSDAALYTCTAIASTDHEYSRSLAWQIQFPGKLAHFENIFQFSLTLSLHYRDC